MKKIYLLMASVLTLIGIGVTRALIVEPGEILPLDEISAGQTVIMGCDISSYNNDPVQFGNNDKLYDNDVAESGVYPLKQASVSMENIVAKHTWLLEAGSEDGWYYIKNNETGRYWSYTAVQDCDPSDPESIPEDAEQWYNEEGFANCEIYIELVADKEQAQQFTFKNIAEGIELIKPGANTEKYQHVIDAATERGCVMIMAKVKVAGKDFWCTMNDAVPGGLSRYTDWAGYFTITGTSLVDDPCEEFMKYFNSIEVKEIQLNDKDPGYVEQTEEAKQYNERMAYYAAEIDNEHDDAWWKEALADCQAWVAKAKAFTYRPVTPGYYRIISAYDQYFLQQGVQKAMYDEASNLKWGNLDEGTPVMKNDTIKHDDFDPENPDTYEIIEVPTGEITGLNQLWEVYEQDGKFYAKNLASQRFPVAMTGQSANYKMAYDEEFIEFNHLGVAGAYNVKVGGKGYALHTGGHGGGSGKSGNIVGWNGGVNSASAWSLSSVSEEDIKATFGEDVFDKAKIAGEFNELLSQAKKDVDNAKASASSPLITSKDQISSPKTETSEGSIANLLDGDFSTYWHSCWTEGNVSEDLEKLPLHYLQFDLGQSIQTVKMKYARRINVGNDHPTEFTIWASNDPNAEEWAEITVLKFTNEAGEETTTTKDNILYEWDLDFGAAYQYVRVRATMTDNWRGYWHASEMNFYAGGGVDLWAKAQPYADALEAAIKDAEAVEVPTQSDVDKLRKAYNDFLDHYTDPTALKAAIATAKGELSSISGGSNPGQKPQAALDALQKAVDAAEAWLKANLAACTKADLTAQEEAMKAALAAWDAVPVNDINTTTWYFIQMSNDRTCHTDGANPWYNKNTSLLNARLAALYADAGEEEQFSIDNSRIGLVTAEMYNATESEPYVSPEGNVYSYNKAMSEWRFIEAGEGLYAIQNRATGNFFPAILSGTQNPLKASVVPGKFVAEYAGKGKYAFNTVYNHNEEGEPNKTYVNLYGQGYAGAWTDLDVGSEWNIVASEAIASDHVQKVVVATDSMAVRGIVLPYAIDLNDKAGEAKFYTDVVSISQNDFKAQLTETADEIAAGKPFLVFDEVNDYGSWQTIVNMKDSKLSWDVDNSGLILGTFSLHNDSIHSGALKPYFDKENTWGGLQTVLKDEVAAPGQAWIDIHNNPDILNATDEGDQYLCLDSNSGKIHDAVEVVKGENGKAMVIYNLNGQRLSAPVKGVMIMNGKKVIVR
ncbi:MAG: discoidin domain-containing protein [Bacteroidaceae bacterium]|nr:discoidin domain-containing protein [Bacteroidaceae bacterium]